MFRRTIFIVFFLNQVTFIESLRCAIDCAFAAFPFNATLPYEACKHVDQPNVQCSVVVVLDFKNRFISGVLEAQFGASTVSLRTESTFQISSNSVKTAVWYTCAMSDNCDYDFLSELMGDALEEFNATLIQQKLIDLLYTSTPDPTGIECSNGSCSSNQFCQAQLGSLIQSKYNYTYINGSLPCANSLVDNDFLTISQSFFPEKSEATVVNLKCNTKECNNDQTVAQAYSILRNEFIVPLNYSILDFNISSLTTTSSPSSAASFLISIRSLIFFICMLLLS